MKKAFFGQIGKLKNEKISEYRELHLHPWPCVLETISDCKITNYSIFMHGSYVFAYFEYTGDDYVADMKKMNQDPITQMWWQHTKPCFEKYAINDHAEYYCDMEQIFYLE